jgi:hypothetical protein
MMQYGVPACRLPRQALLQEVRQIEAVGIAIREVSARQMVVV